MKNIKDFMVGYQNSYVNIKKESFLRFFDFLKEIEDDNKLLIFIRNCFPQVQLKDNYHKQLV